VGPVMRGGRVTEDLGELRVKLAGGERVDGSELFVQVPELLACLLHGERGRVHSVPPCAPERRGEQRSSAFGLEANCDPRVRRIVKAVSASTAITSARGEAARSFGGSI